MKDGSRDSVATYHHTQPGTVILLTSLAVGAVAGGNHLANGTDFADPDVDHRVGSRPCFLLAHG